jgi:hypothetical protein
MGTRNLIPIVFLLLFASAFSWDAQFNEPIKGISALSSGKALAYGNSNIYFIDPAGGSYNYFATDFNFSDAPVYAEQINYVAGFSNSSLVSISLMNGKKTETALAERSSQTTALCYGTQGMFYSVSTGKDESTISALRLEMNGSFTTLNSSKVSGSVTSCVSSLQGFSTPLFLSDNGIIVPQDQMLGSFVTVPMQAVSSNIILVDGKFYAGASGGLLASFNEKGRVFETVSLPDNPMYIYSDASGIIAYGSSGTVYRLSKDLAAINSTTVPAGVAIGIYPSGNGYAVLMGDKLVLLNYNLNAVGDFPFNAYGNMPAFSGGTLMVGKNTLVQGTRFPSGCAMVSPAEYAEVGFLPFTVSGNAFSANNPGFRVEMSVNGESWKSVSGSGSWSADVNPVDYPFGVITIRCRTSDQADARFIPSLTVYRSEGAKKNSFNISVPSNMQAGTSYAILVYDAMNSSVKDFNVSVNNGPNQTISSNRFAFTPSSPGDYTVMLSKDGFDAYTFTMSVGGISLAFLLIIVAIVALVALYVFFSFFRR